MSLLLTTVGVPLQKLVVLSAVCLLAVVCFTEGE